MATQVDYDAGTAALMILAKAIIKEKNVPAFLVPPDAEIMQYAARGSKAVIDAVNAERGM